MSRRLLNLSNTIRLAIALSLLALGVAPAAAQKPADGGTPAELVATYNTLADGLVLDRFYVVDPDYADAPPSDR